MTATPPVPVVTPNAAASPPSALVTAALAADAVTWTLYRVVPNEPPRAVRGASRALAASAIVTDYEYPFGQPVSYYAVAYDVNGTASANGPSSAPFTANVTKMWLQDPLDATSSVAVDLCLDTPNMVRALAGSFATLTHGGGGTVLPVVGSRYPVGVGGTRRAASAISLDFLTETPAQSAAVLGVLERAYPLLVRTPAVLSFLPGAAYLDIGDVLEAPLRRIDPLTYSESIWQMVGTSVVAPGAGAVVVSRVWNDIPAEAATWDALASLYLTWNDVATGSRH